MSCLFLSQLKTHLFSKSFSHWPPSASWPLASSQLRFVNLFLTEICCVTYCLIIIIIEYPDLSVYYFEWSQYKKRKPTATSWSEVNIVYNTEDAVRKTNPCPLGEMKYRQQWTRVSGNTLRLIRASAFMNSSYLLSMKFTIGCQLEVIHKQH